MFVFFVVVFYFVVVCFVVVVVPHFFFLYLGKIVLCDCCHSSVTSLYFTIRTSWQYAIQPDPLLASF